MRRRELDRIEAELHLIDDVADGAYTCTNCGTNIAEFVTPEGLLCRPCHVELIGPVDGEGDDDDDNDPEAHHAPQIAEVWA